MGQLTEYAECNPSGLKTLCTALECRPRWLCWVLEKQFCTKILDGAVHPSLEHASFGMRGCFFMYCQNRKAVRVYEVLAQACWILPDRTVQCICVTLPSRICYALNVDFVWCYSTPRKQFAIYRRTLRPSVPWKLSSSTKSSKEFQRLKSKSIWSCSELHPSNPK